MNDFPCSGIILAGLNVPVRRHVYLRSWIDSQLVSEQRHSPKDLGYPSAYMLG